MKISDLPAPVTSSKADWLAGTTWLGFSPVEDTGEARNSCQSTIQRQSANGYVIEYITEAFGEPNEGFENDPEYLKEREAHKVLAGRFIAVHKLRATSRSLKTILGQRDFDRLQDMWAKEDKRVRWSVAFPIVESYRILGCPKAKKVLGEDSYTRLYAHSSATLRPLTQDERQSIANLEIEQISSGNAWIGIEDEIAFAEQSKIDPRSTRDIAFDLTDKALEGVPSDRRGKIRKRAGWLADRFIQLRRKTNRMSCDDCGFDPSKRDDLKHLSPRSLLDVHHKEPVAEGIRYTTVNDLNLFCPTCHRIAHAKLRAATKKPDR